jgi:hypothetical protein
MIYEDNAITQFKEAMLSDGIEPPDPIEADGATASFPHQRDARR